MLISLNSLKSQGRQKLLNQKHVNVLTEAIYQKQTEIEYGVKTHQ